MDGSVSGWEYEWMGVRVDGSMSDGSMSGWEYEWMGV